jgi:glycosyltransferase involved in cell wall biosynthesis
VSCTYTGVGGKSKLIVFSQWFLPGYRAGGPIRSIANLASIIADDFDVRILTSDRDFGCVAPYENIHVDRWQKNGAASVMYLSPRIRCNYGEVLEGSAVSDCLYLNSMFSIRWTHMPIVKALMFRWQGKIVVSPRGMLHPGAIQFKSYRKRSFLWLFRASGINEKVVFHATDFQEASDIQRLRLGDEKNIVIVPNVPATPRKEVRCLKKSVGQVSLFFGARICPKKNLLSLLHWLKSVDSDLNVSLTVAGPLEDQGYWSKCQVAIRELPCNIQVATVGPLPHAELMELLERHHFAVLPTFGENYGHGIYEAFAASRPVLVSDRTPWRRLSSREVGWDCSLEDSVAWIRCLNEAGQLSQDRYDRMCQKALAYARQHSDVVYYREAYSSMFRGTRLCR